MGPSFIGLNKTLYPGMTGDFVAVGVP